MDAKQRASFINSIGAQPDAAPKAAENAFTISREGETREVVSTPFAAAEDTPPLTSLSEAAAPAAPEPQPAPAAPFAAAADKPAAPAPAPAARPAPASPFAAVKDKPAAPAPAAAVQAAEEENAFAQGLPDWDLVPPQLSVRRRRTV